MQAVVRQVSLEGHAHTRHTHSSPGNPLPHPQRPADALRKDLIAHFSAINLGNQAAQADIFGQSYEFLIKKFAVATNKKAGEFYTPRSVVRLLVNRLDLKEGESIYDPACGTGGMLLEAIHHVKENHGDDRTLWGKLFAQEKNLTTSAIVRMNLFLHVARIYGWYRGYKDVEGVARVATLDEIAANDHNLNIPRYVEPKVEQEALTVDKAMKRLRRSAEAAFAAEGKLIGILKQEGLLQ